MSHGTDEARASSLSLTATEAQQLADRMVRLALESLAPDRETPVFPDTSAADVATLFRRPLPQEGAGLDAVENDCREIGRHIRLNNHPRMFGYVASPASPPGVFASLVAAAFNSNVTAWRSAPAATEVERTVVRWLAEMIGYTNGNESTGGLLTSGGSMANLVALFIAHRTKSPAGADTSADGLWNAGAPMTVYASDQVHLSVPKAADLLGLGRRHVRLIAPDEAFRMDVRALRAAIESDVEKGLRPFAVVGSAGTVSTGAVDPLADLARVARDHDLWFHVDGAYGALAASTGSRRSLFDGLAQADSVSLDPHKWLYAPLDCGCLLLREPERARAAFATADEDYIKVFEQDADEAFAFWDYGIELSRPFRALKIWTMLRYYGARRLAAAIAEDCALARDLAERIDAADDLERCAPVTLGICCFRYVPPGLRRERQGAEAGEGEALNMRLNALNERILRKVQRGGRAYISNAILRGRFVLRASITNFRTTRHDLDVMLDAVREAAREA